MSLIVGNMSTGLTPDDLVATLGGANDVIRGDRPVLVDVNGELLRVRQVRVEHGGVVVLHLEASS